VFLAWRPVRRIVDRELGLEHQGSVTVTLNEVAGLAESAINLELCGWDSIQPGRCKATGVREVDGGRVEVIGTAVDCRKGDGTVVAWMVIYAVTDGRSFRPSVVKVEEEVLVFDP